MKNFKTFDTNISPLEELCLKGNLEFEKEYIKKTLSIKYGREKIDISFSPNGKVKNFLGLDEVYERFIHLSSMEEDNNEVQNRANKYDSFPCINDNNTCELDCFNNFIIQYKEKDKVRMICSYRMSKMYWIKHIIEKLNSGENIKIIQSSNKKHNGVYSPVVKIYYESSSFKNKFVIILKKRKKGKYFKLFFTTAYPVVLRSGIKRFNSEYKKNGITLEELFKE